MIKTIETNSGEETGKVAAKIAMEVSPGDVIALTGDLGGGKTTFTKGFMKGLGCKEDVTSPTFVLQRVFNLENEKIKRVYHFDVYRVESFQEILDLGWEDLLADHEAIIIVEWADKIKEILPRKTVWVDFSFVDDNTRQIKIKN